MIWGATAWGVLALLSGSIAWTFADDSLIQDFIKQFFRIVPFGFAFHGISQLISASCIALHCPFHSTAINIIRLFLILIPLVYLGSYLWNTAGFFFGIAAGNFVTGVIAWLWYRSSIIYFISDQKIWRFHFHQLISIVNSLIITSKLVLPTTHSIEILNWVSAIIKNVLRKIPATCR